MTVRSIAVTSPARTSSGGGTASKELLTSLEKLQGGPVPSAGVPGVGRVALGDDVLRADTVVSLGTRVVGAEHQKRVFWPLNVAPVDASINRLPYISRRNRLRQSVLRRALGRAVAQADAFVFGSHYARSVYFAQYGAAADKPYLVVPVAPPSLNFDQRHAQWRDDPEDFRILCCSHLDAYKGILQLVEAMSLLPDDILGRVSLRIAGADREPEYADAVRAKVAQKGLDDRIKIRSAHGEELADLYLEADLFVFTSVCENAGSFSLFDAFHAGLPVLCSDRSSMPEVCRGAASMFNPYEPRSLAALISRAVKDDDWRKSLAVSSVAWAEDAPTWDERARAVVTFLNESVPR